MAGTNPPNIPSSISIPSGAPRDILGVAMFLTQLVTQLNTWMARVANALNSVVSGAVTVVHGGTGISVTSSPNEAVVTLLTPVASALGGTGHTAYSDGQLLIGNSGGGLTPATLTAGSGATITNGDGTITIGVSGSGGTITAVNAGTGLSGGGSSGAVTLNIATTGVTAGTYQGITLNAEGQATAAANAATSSSAPANPTGTSSTTSVMMGLAGSITPASSGKALLAISGNIRNSASGDSSNVQLRYGTGTAPANGATATGTVAGSLFQFLAAAANQNVPFTCLAVVTGLTLGTAYWLDVAVGVSAGTANIFGLSVNALEI